MAANPTNYGITNTSEDALLLQDGVSFLLLQDGESYLFLVGGENKPTNYAKSTPSATNYVSEVAS